jgi:hypothetical protein
MGQAEDYTQFKPLAKDKLGFTVLTSEERLDDIYTHHPELRNFWATIDDFRIAIEESYIFRSALDASCRVYYLRKAGKNTELKVVVKEIEAEIGELYGAQPCSRRPPGEALIWKE